MMITTTQNCIPPDLWQQIRDFLAAGSTGQFIGHVSNGEVRAVDFVKRVRAKGQQA